MKLFTELKDDYEFLAKSYDVAEKVETALAKTKIMEIRKRRPEGLEIVYDSDTPDEKVRKIAHNKPLLTAQARKNLMDMAKALMVEKPQETISLLHSVIILEDGEEYPHGFELLSVGMKCFLSEEFIGFFTSLMSQVQNVSVKS